MKSRKFVGHHIFTRSQPPPTSPLTFPMTPKYSRSNFCRDGICSENCLFKPGHCDIAMDVKEEKNQYNICAALPGVKKKSLSVTLSKDRLLTITAHKDDPKMNMIRTPEGDTLLWGASYAPPCSPNGSDKASYIWKERYQGFKFIA